MSLFCCYGNTKLNVDELTFWKVQINVWSSLLTELRQWSISHPKLGWFAMINKVEPPSKHQHLGWIPCLLCLVASHKIKSSVVKSTLHFTISLVTIGFSHGVSIRCTRCWLIGSFFSNTLTCRYTVVWILVLFLLGRSSLVTTCTTFSFFLRMCKLCWTLAFSSTVICQTLYSLRWVTN